MGGAAPNNVGFGYIVDAVELTIDEPKIIYELTKKLYPTIAKRNGTTSSRVERAIRHVIEQVYLKADLKRLDHFLGNIVDPEKGRPTNGAFIAALALKLARTANPPPKEEHSLN